MVNTYTSGDQRYPSVALFRTSYSGTFVVTWETFQQTQGISAGIFDSYGSWSSEFDVKYSNEAGGYVPNVAAVGNSGFVITWGGCLTWGNGTSYVYAQVYSDYTSVQKYEFLVSDRSSQGETCPVVASSSSGFVVAWINKGGSMYRDRLYAQRFNNTGDWSGGEIEMVYSYSYLFYPSVSTEPSGGFVTTWGEEPWDDAREVNGRYFNNSNSTRDLYYIYTNDALFSSVANLSSGGYVVVWQEYNSGSGTRKVLGSVFDSTFYPTSSTFEVSTYNYYQGSNVSRFTDGRDICRVVGLESGGFIVVWATDIAENTGFDVYGQVFDNQGARIGDEFRINTFSYYDQFYPSITVSPTGLFVVVWQSQYQDGSGYGIFGQRFQLNVESSESESSGTEVTATLAAVVLAIIIPVLLIVAYFFYLCRSSAPAADAKV